MKTCVHVSVLFSLCVCGTSRRKNSRLLRTGLHQVHVSAPVSAGSSQPFFLLLLLLMTLIHVHVATCLHLFGPLDLHPDADADADVPATLWKNTHALSLDPSIYANLQYFPRKNENVPITHRKKTKYVLNNNGSYSYLFGIKTPMLHPQVSSPWDNDAWIFCVTFRHIEYFVSLVEAKG